MVGEFDAAVDLSEHSNGFARQSTKPTERRVKTERPTAAEKSVGVNRWTLTVPVDVTQVSLVAHVVPWSSGFGTALTRDVAARVSRIAVELPAPGVATLALPAPSIDVSRFVFSDADDPFEANVEAATPVLDTIARAPVDGSDISRTKTSPPGDVVRLDDRLWYVLQPPLEALAVSRRFPMPHEPFAYQYEGMAFLYPRHSGILADEMGLGKTMQAITAMRLLLRSGEIRSALLVCPKPLVPNWQTDFAHWAAEIPVVTVEGTHQRRAWLWRQDHHGVVIATTKPSSAMRSCWNRRENDSTWSCWTNRSGSRIRRVRRPRAANRFAGRRSWALTGTPIENRLDDLVGIFDFLVPGKLHGAMKPQRVSREIRDYVLRRTKEDVLEDLPPKLYRDAELELTSAQRESYRLAEEEGVWRLTRLGDTATIQHVFELVTRLKQICNFDPATGESAKLERLEADLAEVTASGHKAIVFSQWVNTLHQLADRLRRYHPVAYHGRVAPSRRQQVLEQFRNDADCPLLLLSYGAGGVGLNLQCANYVFLFDRWWNPAVEDQAINRAHRIGSAGPVTVSRFLVRDTIEQRIDDVLRAKRALFDSIFSPGEMSGPASLGRAEIFGLFELEIPTAGKKPAA